MRVTVLFVVCRLALAQAPDPAYEPVPRAYEALRVRDYDTAIARFLKGIEIATGRAAVRKISLIRIAKSARMNWRGQFREARRLAPDDDQVALEHAFLCYETKEQAPQ